MEVYYSEELDILHMRIPERMFVLVLLSEILPQDWINPETGKTVQEMMKCLNAESLQIR